MARVLVVDDSTVARKILIRDLPAGWATSVDHASDGTDALRRIREHPYDVVFLDLNMPILDGYGVLEALQSAPQAAHGGRPAIVVLSGDIQPKAQERALGMGARAFLQKPASATDLRAAIERVGMS